jgi:uncharacterized membrane protein YkoI
MNSKLATALGITCLIAAGGGAAFAAAPASDREATALQGAKVTLPEAIAIAERQTGGQAYDAGADIKDGHPRIAVETNGPKGVQTVTVDAQSGTVLATHAGPEQD